MTKFVLVGGFWIGNWAWRDVAAYLRAEGHGVVVPELTGMGERKGEASPAISLETHIGDVMEALERGDLRDVVLVGHSGASAIIGPVADRLPDRVAGLVFLDTGPIPDGQSVADFSGPTGRADTIAKARDGWRIPLPSWTDLGNEAAGLSEAMRAHFVSHAVDEPLHVAIDPVKMTGGLRADLPQWAILSTIPIAAVRDMIAAGNPWFVPMGGASWRLSELPTGHWPMLSEPKKLADLLATWPKGPV